MTKIPPVWQVCFPILFATPHCTAYGRARNLLALGLWTLIGLSSGAAATPDDSHPLDRWELRLETGYLRNAGGATAIDYHIVPNQLTLQTPPHWNIWRFGSGARLALRARFSLLGEAFVRGPESYYLGFAAAPSVEYWFADPRWSVYGSVGGGVGYIDETESDDAQGQAFTLNWFAQVGLRVQLTDQLFLHAGPYFLHHSNGGQTDPNPGIDAVGGTIGLSIPF